MPLKSGASFLMGDDGTLQIHRVGSDFDGSYRCSVANSLPNGEIVGEDMTSTTLVSIGRF